MESAANNPLALVAATRVPGRHPSGPAFAAGQPSAAASAPHPQPVVGAGQASVTVAPGAKELFGSGIESFIKQDRRVDSRSDLAFSDVLQAQHSDADPAGFVAGLTRPQQASAATALQRIGESAYEIKQAPQAGSGAAALGPMAGELLPSGGKALPVGTGSFGAMALPRQSGRSDRTVISGIDAAAGRRDFAPAAASPLSRSTARLSERLQPAPFLTAHEPADAGASGIRVSSREALPGGHTASLAGQIAGGQPAPADGPEGMIAAPHGPEARATTQTQEVREPMVSPADIGAEERSLRIGTHELRRQPTQFPDGLPSDNPAPAAVRSERGPQRTDPGRYTPAMPATNASARALASADIVSPEVMRGGAERAGADLAMAAAGSGARDMLRELNRQIDAGIDERVPATQANPHSEIRSAAATPLIFAEGTARGAAPNSTVIAPPLSSPDVHNAVSHQLGERLIAMASQGKHTARLQLHPAELGALEIRVSIQDDGAVVSITAQLPQARELIEAGLPRLRELFDASGTNLLDVDVSGSDGGGTQQFERSAAEFGSVSPQVAGVNEPPRFDPVGARSERLLDLLV